MVACGGGSDSIPVKHPTVVYNEFNKSSNSYYIPECCLLLYTHCSHKDQTRRLWFREGLEAKQIGLRFIHRVVTPFFTTTAPCWLITFFVDIGRLLFYKTYCDLVQFLVTFWLQTPTARWKHQQHLSTWQMLNLLAKQKRNLAFGCDSLHPSGKYLLKLDL